MRPIPLRFLLTALTCSLVSSAHADTAAAVHKIIAADFAKMDAAQRRKDFFAPLAFNAPNYVATTLDGNRLTTKDYRDFIPALQARTKNVTMQKVKTTIQTFTLRGDTATVVISQETQISVPVGGHAQISRDHLTRKTIWKKHGGKWLMEQSIQLSETPS